MRSFFLLPLLLLSACATTSGQTTAGPPPNKARDVEVTVKDVDEALLAQLEANMKKVPELQSAQLKSHTGKTAVFVIAYPGELEDLSESLSRVPNPGLKFGSALYKVELSAFDNLAPTVAFVFPQNEQVLNAKEQFITVEVPDKDLAAVTIGGTPAPLYKGAIYRLKTNLNEGRQEVFAVARDRAGNETTSKVAVVVDTTPPALNAQIRLVVEGTVEPGSAVLIDGVEVEVGGDGHYKAEVPVRKGQKTVEIVAIDKTGNKTVNKKDIGN